MSVVVGVENTYSANVVVVRQLENYIDNFSPKDFPLLQRVGMNSYPGIVNTKYEWQRDEAIPLTDTLHIAITSTSDTLLYVHYAERFALNDIVLIGSELVQVQSIDVSADTLTVTRGFAGSTAATALVDIDIYRLGNARPEGSSPGWARQTVTTQPYNYTQIFDEMVSITGTEEVMRNYAPTDLMAWRLDARMQEMYQLMEKALIYNNQRYVGTASLARLSAGLDYWVYDKNNLSSAALAFDDIEDVMQEKFAAFGMSGTPDTLWVNGFVKRKISSWGAGTIQTGRTENVVGNEVTVLDTNFGSVAVELDHLIVPTQAWLLKMDKIQMGALSGRAFKEIDASVPGDDMTKHRVLGEYGFVVKGEDAAADGFSTKIYGISITS
jgi:hypothetical protein